MGIGPHLRVGNAYDVQARVRDEFHFGYRTDAQTLGHRLAYRFAAADREIGPHARLRQRDLDRLAGRRTGFAQDQALAFEIAQVDLAATREAMFRMDEDNDRVPGVGNGVKARIGGILGEHELFFMHENAKALVEIRAKGVTMFDAPPDYAPAFIKSAKKVLASLEAKDPFFKKVLESQRGFASVVVPYTRETSKLSTLIAGAASN